jgi:hypothetical protein
MNGPINLFERGQKFPSAILPKRSRPVVGTHWMSGVLSQRAFQDRIWPANLVEGTSGLIALHRFAGDAAFGGCGSAPRGRDTDDGAGK